MTTSLNDSQVLYHEPTKYVARLRTLKTDKSSADPQVQHGRRPWRSQRPLQALTEKAYEDAFMLTEMGITR